MSVEKYRVITTFCDDVVLKHDHEAENVRDAAYEYSSALADAIIEATSEGPEARHIRSVQLHALDGNDETVRQIESGDFPCADRA